MKKIFCWLLLALFSTPLVQAQTPAVQRTQTDLPHTKQEAAEQNAIRLVISKETEAYYRQDFAAWKACFVQAPYFRQHGYWEGYPNKVQAFNGFDTLQQVKALQFKENRTYWKGSYEKRYNENFRIYNNVAWYTFDQDSFDGTTHQFLGRSVEVRILEKHNGVWKIAYLGFQYLPKEAKEPVAASH